jgi:hypothetical protein
MILPIENGVTGEAALSHGEPRSPLYSTYRERSVRMVETALRERPVNLLRILN